MVSLLKKLKGFELWSLAKKKVTFTTPLTVGVNGICTSDFPLKSSSFPKQIRLTEKREASSIDDVLV